MFVNADGRRLNCARSSTATRRSFGRPASGVSSAISFLARLPIGTLGLSTLLHVRELTGSIAFAGSVVGAQLVAAAMMAPVLGRAIDIRGPGLVLRMTATIPALSILFVFFAGPLQLSRPAILLAAVMTGAFIPPVTTIVRTIWRHRFEDERVRQTAFALDSVLIELSFTLGPALVASLSHLHRRELRSVSPGLARLPRCRCCTRRAEWPGGRTRLPRTGTCSGRFASASFWCSTPRRSR